MATAKAFVRHVEGFTLIGKAASDHWVPVDSDSISNLRPAANNPVQLLLIACAGCVMTDVVDILTKGRHEFSQMEMEMEAVRRAVELSLTKYCSVSLSLDRSTRFFARITLNGTSGEPWEILRNFELYEEQSGL